MKKATSTLAAIVLGLVPVLSQAQDRNLSFNLGATSGYRYRGISQTRLRPTLQGGVDCALTVSKDIRGFVASAALVGARTRSIGGVDAYASPANGKDLGRDGFVLAVRTSF